LGEYLPIGRLFSLGSFFEKCKSSTNSWFFFDGTSCVLILTQNWLGYILGDFFANSSGHPGDEWRARQIVVVYAEHHFKAEGFAG
jgi:hypothetical protein